MRDIVKYKDKHSPRVIKSKGMRFEDSPEKLRSGGKQTSSKMTLQKAIDMGEYKQEFLGTFLEWHTFNSPIC